jgi:cell division protein FtsZ
VIRPQQHNHPTHIHIEPVNTPPPANDQPEMKMVFREEEEPMMPPPPPPPPVAEDPFEEQKRKQAERVAKLRSISFNVKTMDNNAEIENVPAYLRRNINLDNGAGSAEQFYSNYTISDSGQNQAEINTINTFLDGKKPD